MKQRDQIDDELSNWEVLMERSLKGDSLAYRTLLEELRGPLTRFFSAKVQRLEIAEDLLQTTLLRIHLYRHTFDGRGRLAPWVFSIAKNVAHDFFRADPGARGNLLEPESEVVAIEKLADSQTHEASEAEARLTVKTAVDTLNENQLEIIYLIRMMGLNFAEASEYLGIRPGAARLRSHRASRALMDALARSVFAVLVS